MRTGDALPAAARPPCTPGWRGSAGFTYLWLLFVLALGGAGLAVLGESERTRQQREREAELRFRGEAIAAALGRYAERTPLGHLPLPQRLDELLADRRFPTPQRHLRQLYADPFTGQADWELVRGLATVVADPGTAASTPGASVIVGVRSTSPQRLFANTGGHATAHDWVFASPVTEPAEPAEPAPTGSP